MKNFKEIGRKLALTAAAGGIAFGGMLGAEKAAAQDGGDEEQLPDSAHAQVVPEESLGRPSNIAVIEDPGEVPPPGEEEPAVGESFYLGSIDQEVTVMYADHYMRLLMPDEMGGDPKYYQPIERIEINPENTPQLREEKIWSFYWPQMYLDLIQSGRVTQDGQSYAQALGLQGNITRESIWEALQAREGNWPWIPFHYQWGGRAQDVNEGYANPNLPVDIVSLPRNMIPAALGDPPKGWLRIDSYQANLVVPNSVLGVLVDKETGRIRLYAGIESDSFGTAMLLYRVQTVFTTTNGIRPTPKNTAEPWYLEWWENYLKGRPNDFIIIPPDEPNTAS